MEVGDETQSSNPLGGHLETSRWTRNCILVMSYRSQPFNKHASPATKYARKTAMRNAYLIGKISLPRSRVLSGTSRAFCGLCFAPLIKRLSAPAPPRCQLGHRVPLSTAGSFGGEAGDYKADGTALGGQRYMVVAILSRRMALSFLFPLSLRGLHSAKRKPPGRTLSDRNS